jgi:GGDEF domain-containing protein
VRSGLPHRYEALGEALTSGSDVLGACAVAGEDLARDGASMQEALEGLREACRRSGAGDPTYDAVSALVTAWSETTLGYLHQLSCDDPLTGLASQAHLRSRLSELYRVGDTSGHALVVVALPLGDDPSDEAGDHFTRAMRIARAGELARTVFGRDETIARLGRHRVGILCRRDERLGRRVRVLATLLDGSPEDGPVRLWIEGLPGTDHFAGSLLDELARG